MEIKRIEIGASLFEENDRIAEENLRLLREKGIVSFNLMGGPGTGKTAILEKTIPKLQKEFPCGVIEGDIAGSLDSERLKRFTIPIVQINTGGACHLDAHMLRKGLEQLPLGDIKLLFVENVGNLVCPAEFELGIETNVVVSSVTEGEDKPAKYPLMFTVVSICLLNKVDLLPMVTFDEKAFAEASVRANPKLRIIRLSARTGENLDEWFSYVTVQAGRSL